MPNPNLPSWYAPEETPVHTAPGASQAKKPLPAWYAPEPEAAAAASKSQSLASQANDVGANVITGLLRVPGAVGGIPHLIGHTANWGKAQVFNALDALTGGKGEHTGAEMDSQDPVMQMLPSSQAIDKFVESPPGVPDFLTRAINGSGKPGQFYQPESAGGRMFQAGITGAASGGTSLPSAIKTGLSAIAAEGSNELFPNQPALAALAAILTHNASGVGANLAKQGYRNFVEPIAAPKKSAEAFAGNQLSQADHTQPGMETPSRGAIDYAADQTRKAVDEIGLGTSDYDTGGAIRTDLQGRKDTLITARKEAADEAFGEFRGQPPMPGKELAPFMDSPTFRGAVRSASNSVLDRGDKPLTDYFAFLPENAGEPTIVPNAAVPPDVLGRIREKLGDALTKAEGSDKNSVGNLVERFDATMSSRYPQTFQPTRTEFAKASAPINEMETGPVGKVLDSETRYGRRTYSMPQDKVAGTFLRSGALRSDFDALVKGYGGDKAAALKALEGNLADKVQGAVKGDGTLSLDDFNTSVRPYSKTLRMWFPDLAQKFSSAEAAQKTLETLHTQKGLVDDIGQGALRDGDLVTRTSATRWLKRNEAALESSQSKAAVMRLRKIVDALPEHVGGGAEAVVEAAPMVAGGALGGLEGGVLGGITHKIPAYFAGPRMATFRKLYSQAVETAFTDPAEAQRLVNLAAKRGGPEALRNVLIDNAKQAGAAAPIAVNAGTPLPQR